MKTSNLFHLPILAGGFKAAPTSYRARKCATLHSCAKASPNENDLDPSVIAAASASTLCSILGDDQVLKSWCDETMKFEIPRMFDGESEMESSGTEMSDDDEELVWTDVPYTDETIGQFENQYDGTPEEEDLCVIDEAFDISRSSTASTRKQKMPRPKRHKHLFRYCPDISVSCWLSTVGPKELLLSVGYTNDDVDKMQREYTKLLTSNPKDMIAPKLRFLVNVLGGGTGDIGNGIALDEQNEENFTPHNLQVSQLARHIVPTKAYFGARLETSLAPRHAYLAFHGDSLPFGQELLRPQNNGKNATSTPLLTAFLDACTKSPAEFAALCQKWDADNIASRPVVGLSNKQHTAESVLAMDNVFESGIAPFARNQVTADLEKLGKRCTPADIVALLLDHGSNYAEHDQWGSTILHWSAGTGNLEAMKILIEKLEQDEEAFGGDKRDVLWSTCASCSITRDGATPLHWAACGVSNNQFGSGGHLDTCRLLLEKAGDRKYSLANAKTSAGNTPLMWACWSGSIEVAKLLVSAGADPHVRNDNGVSIAHWAASSGSVEMCKYIEELGIEFQGPDSKDNEGKSPFDIALSFGHADVVEWIASTTRELDEIKVEVKDKRGRLGNQS
ncbi:hypothetical protein ACHAWO_006748 [Cyclotella atomus]|uniref:Uncharacterized protein n=1 Tax=Cyclotella atomus TaxID=382360 RepID=A0ABD3N6L5_9STRA